MRLQEHSCESEGAFTKDHVLLDVYTAIRSQKGDAGKKLMQHTSVQDGICCCVGVKMHGPDTVGMNQYFMSIG